jgi:DNA-binding transcriptional LysR family regulator
VSDTEGVPMHRRYDGINIPIEIVRTLVTITDLGSFTKAGGKLGLTQPAISAQVKRAQSFVGGAIFERNGAGVIVLAPLGLMVLGHARTMLAANDQILSLAGCAFDPQPVRVGIYTMYAADFVRIATEEGWNDRFMVVCSSSIAVITKNMADGYIDIACMMDRPNPCGDILAEWAEDLVWVRSRDFVLSPGAPIPVVCWPGNPVDQQAMKALERARLPYRINFTSADQCARTAAVSAGIGLMATSRRHMEKSLVIAKERYLPSLSPAQAVICTRPGVSFTKVDEIATLLRKLAPVEMQLSGC